MNILQITNIGNNKSSGIRNIVPENIKHLSTKTNIFWVNLYGECNLNKSYPDMYNTKNTKFVSLKDLKKPFNKPDLVVFHGIFFFEYYIISRQLKRKGIPYIIVPHGSLTSPSLEIKKIKKKIAFKLFLDKFIRDSLAIQYLTLGERETSPNKWNNNYLIIPNGLNLPIENVKLSSEGDSLLNNAIKIIFIARKSIFHKGIDLLLDACKKCASELRKNNVTIDLYGPNENNSDTAIKNKVKDYFIEDIVKIHGPIYGEEKIKIIKQSDIFILTSRLEGHPVGVIEALSLKKPCLLTKGTNLTKEIEDYNAGWTAENSSESINKALIEAIKDKRNYHKLGKNSEKLSREYSWNKVVRKTTEEYDKLLKKVEK